jgi:catechol 2,3-dioxygenase-like lactoylglutathione lyase family enzyme
MLALLPSLTALPAQQSIPLAGIAHIAIRVKNLDTARAFYQSLGYEEAFDLRKDNVPYESFIKINDHQFIELYPVTPKDPKPQFLHLCFEGDDLQAIRDDYASRGLKPTEVKKAGAGNLLFTMPGPPQPLGPEGKPIPQNIEYTQYMPGSRHSEDFGKHLGVKDNLLSDEGRIAERLLAVALSVENPAEAREFYLNDLNFKPLPGKQTLLHLPGNSGEYVSINSAASQGMVAQIVLETESLSRAERHLKHKQIAYSKVAKLDGQTSAIMFHDPDGNILFIEAAVIEKQR